MIKQELIKPFSVGLVAGGAAIAIVALSAGWVVTGSARDEQVQAAWVDGQASICASLAQAHRKASGDATDISGWQAHEARNELAKAFAVALPGQQTAPASVVSACSDLLNKNST